MSSGDHTTLETLPQDVLYHVLSFLDVKDILSVRRASRTLHAVTQEREVWANAYRSAAFVRPPGPYPRDSAKCLERMLVQSAEVEWRTRTSGRRASGQNIPPVGPVRVSRLEPRGRRLDLMAIVLGRWLFVAPGPSTTPQDLCYFDLDTYDPAEGQRSVLIYRAPTGSDIVSLACEHTTTEHGERLAFVFVNVLRTEGEEYVHAIQAFRVRLDGEAICITPAHTLNWSTFYFTSVFVVGPRLCVMMAGTRKLQQVAMFDVLTDQTIIFPIEQIRTDADLENHSLENNCISTSTHVLFFSNLVNENEKRIMCRVDAYVIPRTSRASMSSPTESDRPLTLKHSHSGLCPGLKVTSLTTLMHDTRVIPCTDDLCITISAWSNFDVGAYGHLKLSPPNLEGELGSITWERLSLSESVATSSGLPFSSCLNGLARVFYDFPIGLKPHARVWTVDASTGRVQHAPLQLPDDCPKSALVWCADGYSGKIILSYMEADRIMAMILYYS